MIPNNNTTNNVQEYGGGQGDYPVTLLSFINRWGLITLGVVLVAAVGVAIYKRKK